jgi:GTP-binding protein HflX
VLLVDTVGFIRRLPHFLIDAFRSTLEEAAMADLLVHVLDASDPAIDRYYETTLSVLRELGADQIPAILALNKIDKIDGAEVPEDLLPPYAEAVPLSAVTGRGFPELLSRMESLLSPQVRRFRFPQDRTDLEAQLYRGGAVLGRKYEDGYIEMEARVDGKTAGRLKQYTV